MFITVNGYRLYYEKYGEGRPLILLHGNGEDHTIFDRALPLLEKRFCCYLVDSRSHGQSEEGELHYESMATDMFCFLEMLDLRDTIFYGYSDGGIIGLLLELLHPGTLGMMAASGVNLSPEGIEPSFIEEFTEINRKNPDPLITLMLTEPHIEPEGLENIDIPVLLTAGENDLILPEETMRIAAHLPRAQLVIVKGEDHGSYIDGSEIMGDLLLAFFETGAIQADPGLYDIRILEKGGRTT